MAYTEYAATRALASTKLHGVAPQIPQPYLTKTISFLQLNEHYYHLYIEYFVIAGLFDYFTIYSTEKLVVF